MHRDTLIIIIISAWYFHPNYSDNYGFVVDTHRNYESVGKELLRVKADIKY